MVRPLHPGAPGFVAAHRVVNEVAAGRPVVLRDGRRETLIAPLDGGEVLSGTLAIAGTRAAHLGLPPIPSVLEADPSRLWPLASGQTASLTDVVVREGGDLAAAATEVAKLAERLPAVTLSSAAAPPGTLAADVPDVLAFRKALAGTVRPVATAPVPLSTGVNATVTAFRDAIGGIVTTVGVGPLGEGALVRVHSSCITGDVFGSLKCDCGEQLALSLGRISADGGVLVYTAQEGRGIGLANKLRAYTLQAAGLDTVDANLALGFHDDERDYAVAAAVLAQLGLTSVRLLTNNPTKAAGLAVGGLTVVPEPLQGPVNPHNAKYLATKREKSGHRL
ncbi:MAG: GTP cyclohydrolase II [Pseudomonadota bacterium]